MYFNKVQPCSCRSGLHKWQVRGDDVLCCNILTRKIKKNKMGLKGREMMTTEQTRIVKMMKLTLSIVGHTCSN